MAEAVHTVCALLTFDAEDAPSFDRLATLLRRRTEALPYDYRTITEPRENALVIDVDGARVLLAVDVPKGQGRVQVVLAVGAVPGADPETEDCLRGQRGAFCRLLVEAAATTHDPLDLRWFRDFALPDIDLAEALLHAVRYRPLASPSSAVALQRVVEQVPVAAGSLRAALYGGLPVPSAQAGGQSVPLRLATGVMTSVVTVASLPLGLAMLAWNGTQGGDLRVTAAALATVGLVQGATGFSLMPLI